jgi:type II secretory pathway pseudopilin PulG
MKNSRGPRSKESGYSLIEVIFATALLGIVSITIFTLFVMGRRNVYSGKQASQAVAIGTQVMEDLEPLNKQMVYNGAFGIPDTDTGNAITLPRASGLAAPSFTNARIRSTDATIVSGQSDISTENAPPGLLAKWTNMIQGKLTNPSVTVILIPDIDTASPVNNPPRFGTAQLLHIRVFVRWTESTRQREVVLDTVKAF